MTELPLLNEQIVKATRRMRARRPGMLPSEGWIDLLAVSKTLQRTDYLEVGCITSPNSPKQLQLESEFLK